MFKQTLFFWHTLKSYQRGNYSIWYQRCGLRPHLAFEIAIVLQWNFRSHISLPLWPYLRSGRQTWFSKITIDWNKIVIITNLWWKFHLRSYSIGRFHWENAAEGIYFVLLDRTAHICKLRLRNCEFEFRRTDDGLNRRYVPAAEERLILVLVLRFFFKITWLDFMVAVHVPLRTFTVLNTEVSNCWNLLNLFTIRSLWRQDRPPDGIKTGTN